MSARITTAPVMQEFEFQIYDSQMKPMGTIRDKVSYKVYEDAPRDPATAKPEDIELYGPYHRGSSRGKMRDHSLL